MKKLAIIITHPIQYYAPVFKLLHERNQLNIKVYYTWGKKAMQKFDPGFGKAIKWDIPLLEGYPYEWVQNTASSKGSHHFKGIVNPQLIEQLQSWEPDALLVYGWAYHGHLKVMRYFKDKLPVFFRGDSTLFNESVSLKKTLRFLYLRWVYKHVDHAFYVGTNNKTYFKKYGLREAQLTFSPHAVDHARFESYHKPAATALRDTLNIAKDDILILYAGKFEPVKNADLLITAFINIQKPKVHLLLTGDGMDEIHLKNKARQSTSAANIHFLNFQNQSVMPVIYHAADLFCLPSISETWGLAVNEAMVCSKAVLVSDRVGCAIDLVTEGANGSTFKSQSLTDLCRNLEDLIGKGRNGLTTMGLHSKKIINEWTFQKQVIAIESAIVKNV